MDLSKQANMLETSGVPRRDSLQQLAATASLLIILFQTGLSVSAAGPVDETALRSAWALYTQQKYSASADAFESLIRSSTPNARLYYYAATANKGSNRLARAKQLCQYISANFPNSAEAALANKLVPNAAPQTASASDGLPTNLKNKSIEELMQTEEGRNALKEALKQQKSSTTTSSAVASSMPPSIEKSRGSAKEGDRVVTADVIAKDGANGISQFSSYPTASWFECSMAALAMLPRGQELLAEMIRSPGGQGTYIVRFPGNGGEYTITPQKMEESRIRDKALWATLIHCAQLMKFRSSSSESIEDGLTCLTGKKAEKLFAANTTEQALIQFIGEAVKSHNPVVCQATDDFGSLPELVEANQAYTITGFDPATNTLTLRNPHGDNSRRFRLTTDPEHKKFEQLNDGVFKMHISLFPKYFSQVARSSL